MGHHQLDALAENDMVDNAVLVSRCGLPDESRPLPHGAPRAMSF